jgi:DNA polymerase-3 subunit epsilon
MANQLKNQTFICIDCETTGLDPKNDRIIEVAAVKFTLEQNLEELESLIDPEIIIPANSIAIHHITQDMVQGKPTIDKILQKLFDMVGSHPIIGHGIKYDIDIIAHHAARCNIPTQIRQNRVYDTLRLARLYGESPSNSLQTLRMHFNIEEEGAHRAMSDVVVNIQVFKKLAQNFRTIEQLTDALSRPIQMKTMPLGKHKGRLFKEVPVEYLRWAANQEFDEDLLYSIRSELNRRKKGNSFIQSANPFLNL